MANVLVLAEDGCVGFSCAEILRHAGFQVNVGAWPGGAGESLRPDIILAWDPSESVARLIRTAHQGVPLVVCAWAHCQRWPHGTEIAPLPFNAERVGYTLRQTLQRKEVCAPRPRAA